MRRCPTQPIVVLLASLLLFQSITFAEPRGDADDARRRLESAEARLCQTRDELTAAQSALAAAAAQQSGALAALSAAAAQAEASRQAIVGAQAAIDLASAELRV